MAASGEGGNGIVGGGTTGALGYGIFGGGERGINFGGFASFGAFLGGPGYGLSYPAGNNSRNFAVGGFVGAGRGFFLTNAKCAKELKGPIDTASYNFSIPGVPYQISIQVGFSGDAWIGSFTYGPGYGFSRSLYQTNTWTTK